MNFMIAIAIAVLAFSTGYVRGYRDGTDEAREDNAEYNFHRGE